MKRIFEISSALIAMCLVTLTGCSPEELSTDQYVDYAVVLNVYGPQPVVRGGQLRFLGSNLDQVVQVIIPGADPITEIEVVQAGVPSEIRITVPKDGPEVGYVTLVTSEGLEITTKTELTYSEPIVFESLSPESVKAGDVITITGDYLNLIHEVIFSENVFVSEKDFLKHDRYEIQVRVPEEARTGVVSLGDLDELNNEDPSLMANIITSEEELTVALPVVTGLSPETCKAGQTMTVTGQDLGLVATVRLSGADVTEFQVNEGGTSLSFTLPAAAGDGEVLIVAKSGVEILAGSLETVIPSELSVSASPVKAGSTLSVSGKDLDLVTSVTLPGSVAAKFTLDEGAISFTVPDTAQEGEISLGMANGKAAVVAYTLVKPVVTQYSPSTVGAGAELTFTGTDLDLVTGVTFEGGAEVAVEEPQATQFAVIVPTAALSGTVRLNLANGTAVDAPELTIDKPVTCYVTELPAEGTEIHGGSVLVLPVANQDLLTGVRVNGSDVNHMLNGTDLYVSLPATAGAGTVITLVSSNGTIDYTVDCIPSEPTVQETVIWEGSWNCGNWGGNQDLAWGGYDWSSVDLSAGNVILFVELEQDPSFTYWQFMLKSGTSWNDLAGFSQIDMTAGQTTLEIPLTQTMLDDLKANNGLIITGSNYTLRKITIREGSATGGDVSGSETVAWEGSHDVMTDWNHSLNLSGSSHNFTDIAEGSTLHIDYTTNSDADYSQLQIVDSSWTMLTSIDDANEYNTIDLPAGSGTKSYKLNSADVANIKASGLIVGGYNITVTKVYFTK